MSIILSKGLISTYNGLYWPLIMHTHNCQYIYGFGTVDATCSVTLRPIQISNHYYNAHTFMLILDNQLS